MSVPEPERSDGGYRRYGRGDEERLRFVRGVRRLGFGLGEIREVLALRDRGEPPCSYVAELIEQRAAEVDGQIAELERLKRELAELRDRARRLRPDDCGPEGLLPHPGGARALGHSRSPISLLPTRWARGGHDVHPAVDLSVCRGVPPLYSERLRGDRENEQT